MSTASFIAGSIVDVVTGTTTDEVVIHTDDGLITGLDSTAGSSGEVHDLRPYTVVPGLIDSHVHLTWSGLAVPNEISNQESDELSLLRGVANAAAHLRAGITAVRDLGSRRGTALHLAAATRLGIITAPEIVASGNLIAMTGGHAHYLGVQADGPWAVTKAVRTELAAGAGVIKIMASEGLFGIDEDPRVPQFEIEELRAGAQAAHRAGKTIAAHAYGAAAITNALAAGVDTVEHGAHLEPDQAEKMASSGTIFVPTLSTYHSYTTKADALGFNSQMRATAHETYDRARHAVHLAQQHKVAIAAGTDAGVPGQPHGALATELRLLVDAGLSPAEALRAATVTGAAALNLSTTRGRLTPGMTADLIALDGNPLEDITATARVRTVVQCGRIATKK